MLRKTRPRRLRADAIGRGASQATDKSAGPTVTPIIPLVDIDQEETRDMPATGLRYTWKHGASVVIGVLILTAFFVFIGD